MRWSQKNLACAVSCLRLSLLFSVYILTSDQIGLLMPRIIILLISYSINSLPFCFLLLVCWIPSLVLAFLLYSFQSNTVLIEIFFIIESLFVAIAAEYAFSSAVSFLFHLLLCFLGFFFSWFRPKNILLVCLSSSEADTTFCSWITWKGRCWFAEQKEPYMCLEHLAALQSSESFNMWFRGKF